MIEQAPGCGDYEIHAGRERLNLRPGAHAAENQRATYRQVTCQHAKGIADLRGQFPCRHQHQHARRALRLGLCLQTLQQGQREGGGFAGAGLRGREQVASFEHQGDRPALNGRGLGVAEFLDRTQQRRA